MKKENFVESSTENKETLGEMIRQHNEEDMEAHKEARNLWEEPFRVHKKDVEDENSFPHVSNADRKKWDGVIEVKETATAADSKAEEAKSAIAALEIQVSNHAKPGGYHVTIEQIGIWTGGATAAFQAEEDITKLQEDVGLVDEALDRILALDEKLLGGDA